MINLNIQKTYSNAYTKKTGMQSNLGNVNNIKQDTVSFNGWLKGLFSSKPPEILVSQEVYDKICGWAKREQGGYAVVLMQNLKSLCEGETAEAIELDALIGAQKCQLEFKEEVSEILQQALNTSTQRGLGSFINLCIQDLCKYARKL